MVADGQNLYAILKGFQESNSKIAPAEAGPIIA